ncbi:hypothetical protein ACLK25_00175 [Leptospira kirschneri]|uniref:hypothetical protein n=2 Tax=Leptospira kirschneri TaxID=29507 RepID=UPI00398B1755
MIRKKLSVWYDPILDKKYIDFNVEYVIGHFWMKYNNWKLLVEIIVELDKEKNLSFEDWKEAMRIEPNKEKIVIWYNPENNNITFSFDSISNSNNFEKRINIFHWRLIAVIHVEIDETKSVSYDDWYNQKHKGN